jgi:DNA repair photolyase
MEERPHYLCDSYGDFGLIRTRPGITGHGRPFDWFVRKKVKNGEWRLECIKPEVLGTKRPLEVYRARRSTSSIIKPWPRQDDDESYCPAHWADLAIGRGACGYRCRSCFLILTHRGFCDPSRHVLYENLDDYELALRKWLQRPNRRNLGLGIDCSDSLLYEGVVGHARRLIPMFANEVANPNRCKLILLTKSANVHYLKGLPTRNIILSMSLNPESVADVWEGKWNDGLRITPAIKERLAASRMGEDMGFEVRWRVDPVLPINGWQEVYTGFFAEAAMGGHKPSRITLGSYREMSPSLLIMAGKWGLPPVEWKPMKLMKEGSHYHLPADERVKIYSKLREAIDRAWSGTGHRPVVALCKESRTMRSKVGLLHEMCNCG